MTNDSLKLIKEIRAKRDKSLKRLQSLIAKEQESMYEATTIIENCTALVEQMRKMHSLLQVAKCPNGGESSNNHTCQWCRERDEILKREIK